MASDLDVVIENGLVFDGRGSPPRQANVGIADGRVRVVSEAPLVKGPRTKVVDATGRWVTPGFIDLHTHYDAEIEVAPGLSESVRHGVTTVMLGSCSLSLAVGTAEDLADQYARVEAIPYDFVRELLEKRKDWQGYPQYFAHLDALPLGPNVASFVGHSALRAHVMGMERSLDKKARPTAQELEQMQGLLAEGLDAGAVGVSIQTLPWDKVGGTRAVRSRPLPSVFARWSEYRALTRLVRARDRVLQGVPNITTKLNVVLFLLESAGFWWRKALKTTVISMMSLVSDRKIYKLIGFVSRVANKLFKADFRWQALPEIFDLWADGIDLVVFEEFGAGAAALHLSDVEARQRLLEDPAYRAWFKKQWKSRWLPRAFHRNFHHSKVLECPDKALVGKSFTEIALARGEDVSDTFLDLCARYGSSLRWYTVMANAHDADLEQIVSHPDVLIGFSDAGAHLRNMAHYNFPLRLLRLVHDAQARGFPFMTPERAVQRLTGEIGEWLGLDAGVLEPGRRADVVVLDPEKLTRALDVPLEAPLPGLPEYQRLVNTNLGAVDAVLVNGRFAVKDGEVTKALGAERLGRVLKAGEANAARSATPPAMPRAA